MSEFKIGDRVVYIGESDEIERGELGTVRYIEQYGLNKYEIGVEWDKGTPQRHDGWGCFKGKPNHCWYIWDYEIKKLNPYQKIVITCDKNTTTAKYYENDNLIRTAEAKCAPEDTFDFMTGAALALSRLAEKPKQIIKLLYCVKDHNGYYQFKKGKAYNLNTDYHIVDENGKEIFYKIDTYDDFKIIFPELASIFVPLIYRPAKTGEWVYVLNKSNSNYEPHKIYRVYETGKENCVWFSGDYRGSIDQKDYLVLDGYKPVCEKCGQELK